MKNYVFTILLGCALICSVGLNIYLFWNMSEAKESVTAFSSQVVTAENQITDIQGQIADLETLKEQATDLQGQLADNEEQIQSLEAVLAENNAQIESLETTLTENNATIAELEEQAAKRQQSTQQNNTGNSSNGNSNSSSNNSSAPVNPMPQGSGSIRDDSAIGDGSGANGMYGTFE